jgi:hypothetical protein
MRCTWWTAVPRAMQNKRMPVVVIQVAPAQVAPRHVEMDRNQSVKGITAPGLDPARWTSSTSSTALDRAVEDRRTSRSSPNLRQSRFALDVPAMLFRQKPINRRGQGYGASCARACFPRVGDFRLQYGLDRKTHAAARLRQMGRPGAKLQRIQRSQPRSKHNLCGDV